MGKKTRQESLKTSSNKEKKQQVYKVLRPKVYITERSSFKRLVQELTGNGRSSASVLSPPTTPQSQSENDGAIFIDVQTYLEEAESSFDASTDELSNQQEYSITQLQEEAKSPWHYHSSSIYTDDDIITSDCLLINQHTAGGCEEDLESLLRDIDRYTYCSSNYGNDLLEDNQVGGCDYQWPGLLY